MWDFDCAAGTADRLDFASMTEDGEEGPLTSVNADPAPPRPGGDAEALLALACSGRPPAPDARSLQEAVRLGRERLAAASST